MHFCAPLVIGNIIGNDIAGGLIACPGSISHPCSLASCILFDKQWRVVVYLSCENFGQQPPLQFQTASIRHVIAKEGMSDFFVESLLKLGEENLAPFIFESVCL